MASLPDQGRSDFMERRSRRSWNVLPTSPRDHDYPLAAWVVYQAGGIYLQDMGHLLVIKTTGFSDLTDPVQKAACTQVV